jgi:hypothetical protein
MKRQVRGWIVGMKCLPTPLTSISLAQKALQSPSEQLYTTGRADARIELGYAHRVPPLSRYSQIKISQIKIKGNGKRLHESIPLFVLSQ